MLSATNLTKIWKYWGSAVCEIKSFVAVRGLDLRLILHRETQYTMKARMEETTGGCWVFRKFSHMCFRLFWSRCEDCWKCRDCLLASVPELHSCWILMGPRCRPNDFYSILLKYFNVTRVWNSYELVMYKPKMKYYHERKQPVRNVCKENTEFKNLNARNSFLKVPQLPCNVND